MPPTKPFSPRKLLIAVVGVASINYLGTACGGAVDDSTFDNADGAAANPPTAGNLAIGHPQPDAAPPPTSGNLAAPIDASAFDATPTTDADVDGGEDGGS